MSATPKATAPALAAALAIVMAVAAAAAPAGPDGAGELRVVLEIPALEIHPGDDFYLRGYLDNPAGPDLVQVPVVFVLETGGELYFWPSWAGGSAPGPGFDLLRLDVPQGTTLVTVVPVMTWPETGTQALTGLRFHGAMLTDGLDDLRGRMATVEWGFGPPSDLALEPESVRLTIGASQEFQLTGGLAPFAWELSEPAPGELEVGLSGRSAVFTALAEGAATLTVTGADGHEAAAEIEVDCPPIVIKPSAPAVPVGETVQFAASGGSQPYRWESSFIFAGQIDADGLFIAGPLTGITRISAYDSSGCSGWTDVEVVP